MPIRITGLNSGLDTEALVSELVSAYRTKSQKYVKAQKKLAWKQNAWAALNTKVTNFYSSITNLKYSSAYNLKSANISDTTKASVSASSSAVSGSYTLKISQTAKTGYLTGAELGSSISGKSTLSSLGYSNGPGTITVTASGKTTDISIDNNTTVEEFVTKLNEAGVKANYDSNYHRIYVSAHDTGAKNDFSLVGGDAAGMDALSKLGLSVQSKADMEGFKNMAAYALNTNGTAYITGYDADGKAITDGTYDEAATKANITAILSNLTNASTTVTNDSAKLTYAEAYERVMNADKNLSVQDQDSMKALMAEKDLSNVYIDGNGKIYDRLSDGTYTRREDNQNFDSAALAAAGVSVQEGAAKLMELEHAAGLATKDVAADGTITYTPDEGAVTAYKSAMRTMTLYAQDPANTADRAEVAAAYANGTIDTLKTTLKNQVDTAQAYLDQHKRLNGSSLTPDSATAMITNAAHILDGTTNIPISAGATRVDGQDATIILNNASYTSSSNTFTINGLTINALAPTGTGAGDELTVTVSTNTQGLYDKIKGFLKEYNALINEMTKLYNADAAKGMEPLTNEEKDAMSDSEIEEWEKKIQESLLRRDDSLESIMYGMTNSMLKSYEINGKQYSLASFGIKTLGVLNAKDNEHNAYHIDGDSEDSTVSGNPDQLMAALATDPDAVVEFMKKLTGGLYDTINEKMKSTKLSSFNKVYNDKQMAKEYSDYTTTIQKWEDKLADLEDSYYKKFAAMESALATLQSQQSSLASLLG